MELFGEEIVEHKVREPKPLAQYNEKSHLEALKTNDIELYENEYHLVEQTLNLPQKYMELSTIEQQMVLLFVDKDFVEPNSEQKTENNAFISFLAAYPNKTVVKKIYKTYERLVGHTKDGDPLYEKYKGLDPDQFPLYTKLKLHSATLWKTNNLKEISKSMREILTNDGYRDAELLKQKIISDAMSDKRDSFTMQNRREAVKIEGMIKPQGLQQINVFLKGGGKEANEAIVSVTGNDAYDLIPKVEEVSE